MRTQLLIASTLLSVLAACSTDAEGKTALKFTAIPNQDATYLKQSFDPVAKHLSEKLGVPVEFVPSANYAASVDMFKNGDVHLAWFGGLTGVQARHFVPGAHAIVKGEKDAHFVSYFIAHKNSGLSAGDEFPMAMAGKKFTFGSRGSTSGRLMPEHFIKKATGKSPEQFFAQISFSGSHDKTAELVQSGQFDCGVLDFSVYERRVKEGKTDPEVCKVIWKSPEYADYNFTAHPDLETLFGEGFTKRLQTTLLEMTDPKLLAGFVREKLVVASDAEFDGIKKVAEALNMLDQ
jgi:phosphonate transport system substrate-binding protein